MDRLEKEVLAKIILTLQSDHHDCKEEAINIAKDALGIEIEHNRIREMINQVPNTKVKEFVKLVS